eukprot:4802761-Pyramimonas_sp.AAC.1
MPPVFFTFSRVLRPRNRTDCVECVALPQSLPGDGDVDEWLPDNARLEPAVRGAALRGVGARYQVQVRPGVPRHGPHGGARG